MRIVDDIHIIRKDQFDDRGIELAEHMVHAIRMQPYRLGVNFSEDEIERALKALGTVRTLTKGE